LYIALYGPETSPVILETGEHWHTEQS